VYYYLEEYDEALTFALGAGNAFQRDSGIPGDNEYIETLICELCPEIHGLSTKPCHFSQGY
jgi:26S proteasome regulatory subunit N2